MTCNNYVNIKEINNLEGANKLEPSLKRRKDKKRGGKEKKISFTPSALSSKSKVM